MNKNAQSMLHNSPNLETMQMLINSSTSCLCTPEHHRGKQKKRPQLSSKRNEAQYWVKEARRKWMHCGVPGMKLKKKKVKLFKKSKKQIPWSHYSGRRVWWWGKSKAKGFWGFMFCICDLHALFITTVLYPRFNCFSPSMHYISKFYHCKFKIRNKK